MRGEKPIKECCSTNHRKNDLMVGGKKRQRGTVEKGRVRRGIQSRVDLARGAYCPSGEGNEVSLAGVEPDDSDLRRAWGAGRLQQAVPVSRAWAALGKTEVGQLPDRVWGSARLCFFLRAGMQVDVRIGMKQPVKSDQG